MHVHNVHTREIAAPSTPVGDLLDELGRDGGRIWPADRWPTAPMDFDRGLEIGSSGGHGQIRYVVDEHVPGRSVTFRFTPEMALDGFHRLDVEPLSPGRTRLIHTLEAEVGRELRFVAPVLLGFHDAMVEDMLARADHFATGAPLRYPRIPLWLRLLNAAEIAGHRCRTALTAARARPAG
jgi:hypothetical protein